MIDAVVEQGKPADSSRCLTMIERHAEIYGSVPVQVAFDAGYASKRNLHEAKAFGVTDMVFERKRGLHAADMASTSGVYDKLRRFRADIKAISYLKRCFGLRRCYWRGLDLETDSSESEGLPALMGPASAVNNVPLPQTRHQYPPNPPGSRAKGPERIALTIQKMDEI